MLQVGGWVGWRAVCAALAVIAAAVMGKEWTCVFGVDLCHRLHVNLQLQSSCVQRIEGHFRTEQAARRRTEEALALAAGERDALRGQLEAERMQQVGRG